MDAYTYGDQAADQYAYGNNNLAINTETTNDISRSNTNKIIQITKSEKTGNWIQHIKDCKKLFTSWRQQYDGLTFGEAIVRFIYNLSHSGITLGSIVYCAAFTVVISSTLYSNYVNQVFVAEYVLINLFCILL
eukprot:144088_1